MVGFLLDNKNLIVHYDNYSTMSEWVKYSFMRWILTFKIPANIFQNKMIFFEKKVLEYLN